MIDTKTDWRQFRKSTHLASADLDAMELAGKELIFTIKTVQFLEKVDVCGTKMDGVFVTFMENVKPWKLNTTNCKTLAGFCKKAGFLGKEANVIENWAGMVIELYVDRNVKMMGATTDGIRIKPLQPKPKEKEKPIFTEEKFDAALEAKATIEFIKSKYIVSAEIETQYLSLLNGE